MGSRSINQPDRLLGGVRVVEASIAREGSSQQNLNSLTPSSVHNMDQLNGYGKGINNQVFKGPPP